MTKDELKAIVLGEVNLSSDATALTLFEIWYPMYSDRNSQLQLLYLQKRCVSLLMGRATKLVDVIVGLDESKNSQYFNNLATWMKSLNDDLAIFDPYGNAPTMISVLPDSSFPETIAEEMELANRWFYGCY